MFLSRPDLVQPRTATTAEGGGGVQTAPRSDRSGMHGPGLHAHWLIGWLWDCSSNWLIHLWWRSWCVMLCFWLSRLSRFPLVSRTCDMFGLTDSWRSRRHSRTERRYAHKSTRRRCRLTRSLWRARGSRLTRVTGDRAEGALHRRHQTMNAYSCLNLHKFLIHWPVATLLVCVCGCGCFFFITSISSDICERGTSTY